MASERLTTCIQLPLFPKELDEVSEKAKDWVLMHGASMRSKEQFNRDQVQFVPFALLPSSFPRKEFTKARDCQTLLNEMVHKVAHDSDFIRETLKSTVEVDDFTAKLFQIYETVCAEGITQPISLGLLRSDYLLHSLNSSSIKQVELNTIASSFGGIGTTITEYHRYILKELGHEDKLTNIPLNDARFGLSDGLIDAWKLYDSTNVVILFVVEDIIYNICDQRFLEFEIRSKNPEVKIIRKSLGQLSYEAKLGPNKELIVGTLIVGVVYFRSGYEPGQYPTNDEWATRLLIERSRAIKCPSIQYHLAGTKKVQQALIKPGILEKYFTDSTKLSKIRDIFTGLYSLDFDEEGDNAVTMSLREPQRFVLKPQREGGGNNIYGDDIRVKLESMKNSKERKGWILMDLIRPPLLHNYLVKPRHVINNSLQDVICELGIYGVILGDPNEIHVNRQVGHVLRTKSSTENEGGIVAGAGALDSPYLID